MAKKLFDILFIINSHLDGTANATLRYGWHVQQSTWFEPIGYSNIFLQINFMVVRILIRVGLVHSMIYLTGAFK